MNLFLPLLILMIAWLFWTGFQTTQLMKERSGLVELHENQEPTVVTAQQMRGQLDALAAGTKRLADEGHPHASLVVQELARRGVTINPNVSN
ncbi:hypothetical protein CKO42_25195 [Lamprobacter modestohalophilus]|uniref:Uncharacterized protein n=2 Tax=Lamprobacter modestohalophilus TaxID=1064514 RepID=A0A9X1B6H8_9GAMM|nr:hypothetical protein [Lamprobacter modestohalophilus]